jgi:hypothetical protein
MKKSDTKFPWYKKRRLSLLYFGKRIKFTYEYIDYSTYLFTLQSNTELLKELGLSNPFTLYNPSSLQYLYKNENSVKTKVQTSEQLAFSVSLMQKCADGFSQEEWKKIEKVLKFTEVKDLISTLFAKMMPSTQWLVTPTINSWGYDDPLDVTLEELRSYIEGGKEYSMEELDEQIKQNRKEFEERMKGMT